MATPLPVLMDAPIKALPDGQLWLGGGEVDLKLRLDLADVAKWRPAGRPVEFAVVTA